MSHFVFALENFRCIHSYKPRLLTLPCRYDFNDVDDGSVSADFANADECDP